MGWADLVSTNFKSGKVEGGIAVGGAGDVSESRIECGFSSVDIQRDIKFKEFVALTPVNFGVESN